MTRKEHYDDQIELCMAALEVSEGSMLAVVRARLAEVSAIMCAMTGREGRQVYDPSMEELYIMAR